MFSLSTFDSKEEISKIVSAASGMDECVIEEFILIILKYYDTLIEKNDDFTGCYFSLNDKYSSDNYSTHLVLYKVNSYCLERLINKNMYRISFDSYGILLFKLFASYISGGISGTVFMSLESIVEYLITSNEKLSNTETCVLYTILLDSKCMYGYFDADYLYAKYYEELSKKNDTCIFNLTEVKCFFNEYSNRCTILKKDIDKILCRLADKKILVLNEIEKYKIK